MFDLFRRSPILSIGWFFDKEAGAGGGAGDTEDSTEDESKEKDESKAGDEPEDKKFSQEELDAIITDRLKREREKAEKESAAAKKRAEEDALKKNQEWQTLAEQRATELADLTKERDELVPYKDQAERYKTALESQLTTVKKGLPKHITDLIDKMDPVDQLTYISDHAKELAIKPGTYGETPDHKERKVNSEDEKEAQKASGAVITRSF